VSFLSGKRGLIPIILFIAICFALSAWSTINGRPAPSIDNLTYKYPGFQLVKHSQFSVPAMEGFYKGIEKIFLLHPPLYPLCFAGWILIFGFSLPSALAFEFFLHFLIALCLYKIVNKLLYPKSEYWAFFAGLVYFFPVSYLDRPERLSILLGLTAFYIIHYIPKLRIWLKAAFAGILSGLALSSHLIVGGLYLIYLAFSVFDKKSFKEPLRFIAIIFGISTGVLACIWLPFILPNKEFFAGQFIKHFLDNLVGTRDIPANLMGTFKYLKFAFPLIAALLIFPFFSGLRNGKFAIIGIYFIVGLCAVFTSTKSTYFASLVPLIYISVIKDIVLWFKQPKSKGAGGVFIKAVFVSAIFFHLMPAIPGNLTPFFAQKEDRYDFSYARIAGEIPQGAKVLTDGVFWYCLAGKARIYDSYFTWPEQIKNCDYILLSANGSGTPGVPSILKKISVRDYIENNFKVVDTTLSFEPNMVFKIPVSHSRWGYRFVLFKRKSGLL